MSLLSVLIKELKPIIPTTILLAPSIPYFIATLGWHGISLVLPEHVFRYVDDKMYGIYQRLVLFVFENLSGVEITFFGDVDECFKNKENVLYISNHQCTVDWAVVDMVAARQDNLGSLRYMLKDSLQYIPLYGWYFYCHGCVYVRRGGQFQSDIAEKQLTYLSKTKVPIWMVIFPEGTRYTPKKLDVIAKSRKFAESRGYLPLEHALTPRVKGVKLALDFLREKKLDAVYDVTIIYNQSKIKNKRVESPDMFSFVCCPPETKLFVYLKRIPIDDVPSEETELERWLYQRFCEKDLMLKEYYVNNILPTYPVSKIHKKVIPLSYTLPSAIVLTVATVAMLSSPTGRQIYLAAGVFGTLGCIVYMKLRKAA